MIKIYVIEVLVAAIFFIAATVVYGMTPWRDTWPGRILFLVLFNLSLVLTLIVASYWLGEYPGKEIVRFVIYTTTLVTAIVIFSAVIIGQVRGRRVTG